MKCFQLPFLLLGLAITIGSYGQNIRIPASHSNLHYDTDGRLFYLKDSLAIFAHSEPEQYSLEQLIGNPVGTKTGVFFNFGAFKGSITYGLIPYGIAPHPLPVYRFTDDLIDGKIVLHISRNFHYPFDFVDWGEKGYCTLGYRLIDETGMIVFDGEVSLTGTGPFKVVPTIYEGPFVNQVQSEKAVVWFNTTKAVKASVEINGTMFSDKIAATHHEIEVAGLEPGMEYKYTVHYGTLQQSYHLRTAPKPGSRQPFVFAYTSDSRHATGGGERKLYGANAYIMKKMAALAYREGAAFIQFTGDMIDGYLTSKAEQMVQYTNWKKSVEPFWHYIPFYVGIGNHEALGYTFGDEESGLVAFVDGFPYDTFSAEAAFQEAFVNPQSKLISEDGSKYDPDSDNMDFPSYQESVYYYTHGNVAMVVLNSDYWYAPTLAEEPGSSGGLHGYIMDNQLKWLRKTIKKLEKDSAIDHIFVTQHTPAFPNGGHSRDDMWYSGDNEKRPFVNGQAVEKGIIQRRDEYLNILINESKKVVAILTGDEHNYNWLKLTDEVPIYPEGYPHERLTVSRPIYQINNGACGAPYYAQERLPWSSFTKSFSVENAVCLFYVEGDQITMKVVNPDTLNDIDEVKLR